MSEAEQDAAIGKAVREFVEVRNLIAKVRDELGGLLKDVDILAGREEWCGSNSYDSFPKRLENIRTLLVDNDGLVHRIGSLRCTLREYGLELKS